jgi:hypothetical protein
VGEFLREGRHTVDVVVGWRRKTTRRPASGAIPEVAPGSEPTLREVRWVDVEDLRGIELLPAPTKERLLRDAAARWPAGEVYLASERA